MENETAPTPEIKNLPKEKKRGSKKTRNHSAVTKKKRTGKSPPATEKVETPNFIRPVHIRNLARRTDYGNVSRISGESKLYTLARDTLMNYARALMQKMIEDREQAGALRLGASRRRKAEPKRCRSMSTTLPWSNHRSTRNFFFCG